MKKNTIAKKTREATDRKRLRKLAMKEKLTIGIDLGDRSSRYCMVDEGGDMVSEGAVPTTAPALQALFGKMPASRIALEVGTHSPWVSRLLTAMGHEVVVANAHKVKLITASVQKNDRVDARTLARLARIDPALLAPIHHRGEQAQVDLAVIRSRAELMESRTGLINCIRGTAKPFGERVKACDADQVKEGLAEGLSEAVQQAVRPLLRVVETMSQEIAGYDQKIEEMAKRYPEIELLTAVYGVGTLIALTFVLVIEDPKRFEHSRDVGCYLGLQPRQRESGESKPQLGITKAGDRLLRSYLVQAAHCMLRKKAEESDLRTWGLKKAESGGKRGKKRALVAMARKLAVLLHRLWDSGEVYDPQYNAKAAAQAKRNVRTAA